MTTPGSVSQRPNEVDTHSHAADSCREVNPGLLRLSVVVPRYNEEDSVRELHRRVSSACQGCVGDAYELVLVNDGSSDATWKILRDLSKTDQHVVAVDLSRNHGHQLALSAGLQLCRGARIFILDADLQDPPELLPDMMAYMDSGCDVVFGQRIKRDGETAFKKLSASGFYRLFNWMVDIDIPRETGDFRLMSRRALDILNSMPEQHRFIRGMVSWIGLRQEALPYKREPRFAGNTKYSLAKMLRFAMDAITGFSVRPLRMASYLGIGSGISTLFLLAYVLVQHFIGNTVPGWTSLAVVVLGLGSIQLFVIGVMGEYLGRLYIESKGRPLFIIQEVSCSGERAEVVPMSETSPIP